MIISARERALGILHDIHNGAYSDVALKRALVGKVSSVDRAFITALVYGIIQNKSTLDYILVEHSHLPLKKMSKWIISILRMGIYQIVFMDKVPIPAAVNESVILAKRYAHPAAAGFVNGVLRSVSKCESFDWGGDLSVEYAHPQWMIDMWRERYGEEFTLELLRANNDNPPVTLRVNLQRTNAEELCEQLTSEGAEIKAQGERWVDIKMNSNIEKTEGYQKGLFTVQDRAAMQAVEALSPKSGETVIDVCAAPGGKTTYMAELMENTGKIFAMDIHENKIDILNKNAERMGAEIIEAQVHNGRSAKEELIASADAVLVDAPCSGLGIIRKKPDIKWRKKPEDILAIAREQMKLLEASSLYLKKGGRMVYSTCTISSAENEEIVERFLEKNDGFELDLSKQLFPHIDNCDGFYIARIIKI